MLLAPSSAALATRYFWTLNGGVHPTSLCRFCATCRLRISCRC